MGCTRAKRTQCWSNVPTNANDERKGLEIWIADPGNCTIQIQIELIELIREYSRYG